MRILATKAEFEGLPDWIREFATAAWAQQEVADGWYTGPLLPVLHFKDMRRIAGRFAERLQEAIRNPDLCENNISLLLTDSPKFVEATLFLDPHIRIAHALMAAWNNRATLAKCEICGSLMQPGRGRVASTCSGACRVKLYRREEQLRKEKGYDDAIVEMQDAPDQEQESDD
jgi:hypothetical protein